MSCFPLSPFGRKDYGFYDVVSHILCVTIWLLIWKHISRVTMLNCALLTSWLVVWNCKTMISPNNTQYPHIFFLPQIWNVSMIPDEKRYYMSSLKDTYVSNSSHYIFQFRYMKVEEIDFLIVLKYVWSHWDLWKPRVSCQIEPSHKALIFRSIPHDNTTEKWPDCLKCLLWSICYIARGKVVEGMG